MCMCLRVCICMCLCMCTTYMTGLLNQFYSYFPAVLWLSRNARVLFLLQTRYTKDQALKYVHYIPLFYVPLVVYDTI